MRDDIARMTEMYAEQGYVYAEINPQIRKAPTGNRIDLMLDVKQGPVVYVNRIEVQGNTRTRDNVIRRDITLEEGSKFDAKALRTSLDAEPLRRLSDKVSFAEVCAAQGVRTPPFRLSVGTHRPPCGYRCRAGTAQKQFALLRRRQCR